MQGEIIRNEKNQTEKMLYSNGDLKKLIIPLIIEQTLAIAVGMADTIMVSAAGEAAGESEWGTADILCIPRWEAVIYDEANNSYTSNSLVNIVWFRGIEFTAVPETGDNA